jgi:hypothetical protein
MYPGNHRGIVDKNYPDLIIKALQARKQSKA